jgi:hypothetical protein
MKYQILSNWYQHQTDWNLKAFDLTVVENWKDIDKNLPILCSGDLTHENISYWLTNNFPALYFARGYVGNHQHKRRNGWMHRIVIRDWANYKLKTIPYSRWGTIDLERHSWKVKKVKNVLIAPSKATTFYWTSCHSTAWAEELSKKFPGANVKIRYKDGKSWQRWNTLFEDLDWADLVVSQSSAITAEAFWYGKKVISTAPCTTWAAGEQSIDDWKNPKEPELREAWHEHVAWSQFKLDEINSGEALELVQRYHGDVMNYNSTYQYKFY